MLILFLKNAKKREKLVICVLWIDDFAFENVDVVDFSSEKTEILVNSSLQILS